MTVLRWLLAWALAVVVTGVLGSIIQTQLNLAQIARLDQPVGLSARLQATMHDLVNFAPSYMVIVALGLLVALLVAAALSRKWPEWRAWLFPLAGFVAVATALGLMSAMLPVTVIAAARSAIGFLLLCLAGALGGWLYAQLMGRTEKPAKD